MRTHRLSPRILKLGALAAIVFACSEPTAPRGESAGTPSPISYAISDAMHADGNRHVFFLPPVVSAPGATNGRFDPNVAAEVDICELTSAGCLTPFIAQFSRTTGSGSETIRVDGEQYIVNWHTDRFPVSANKTYRIRLRVLGTILGFADVQVFSNSSQAKNAVTGETFALVDGRTLPIKFRIEEGAVFVFPLEGGTSTTPDGKVAMKIPAGALKEPAALTIAPAASEIADDLLLAGGVYEFGPSGTQFETPITVTIKFDPADVPAGSSEDEVRLHMIAAGVDGQPFWQEVKGSSVDVVNHTVTGLVPHFSKGGAKVRTPVASVSLNPIPPGSTYGTRTFSYYAYPRDAVGNFLRSRTVTAASSAVEALQTSPLAEVVAGTDANCPNGCYAGSVTAADVVEQATPIVTVKSERATTTFQVTVDPLPIQSTSITPLQPDNSLAMRMYETLQIQVALLDIDGRPVTNRQLTWTGGGSAVGRTLFDVKGYTLNVEALDRGSAMLELAIQGSSVTASIPVNVLSPPAAKLVITPADQTIPFGDARLQVKAYDVRDLEIPDAPVTWTVDQTTVAKLDPSSAGSNALLRPLAHDGATVGITAVSEQASASARVTFLPEPVSRIDLQPDPLSIEERSLAAVGATTWGASGARLLHRAFQFASDDEETVRVVDTYSHQASVSAIAPGSTTIRAASEGVTTGASVTVTPLPVDFIEIAPAATKVQVGSTVAMSMTAFNNGIALRKRTATWSTDNGVVSVDPVTGLVTGNHMGNANIRAVVANEGKPPAIGVVPIEVVAPPIAIMTLEQMRPEVFIGEQTRFVIKAIDADGKVIDGLDYDVTPTNGERIDIVNLPGVHAGSGRIGVPLIDVMGVQPGDVTLHVQVPGTNSVAEIVFAVRSRIDHIAVTPATLELLIGNTRQLSATAFDVANAPLPDIMTWSSSDEAVAAVDAAGKVTGIVEGSATITAVSQGKTATVQVSVVRQLKVATVEITPAKLKLTDIEQKGFAVELKSADGTKLGGRTVEWKISDPTIGYVSQYGFVYAQKVGTATVTATSEGVTGSAVIEVTPEPTTSIQTGAPRLTYTSGESDQVSITPYAKGRPLVGRTAAWSSTLPDRISLTGLQTASNTPYAKLTVGAVTERTAATVSATIEGTSYPVSELTLLPSAGKIVLNADAATLSNEGFEHSSGAAQYARNIASWFNGGSPARFLACVPAPADWTRFSDEINASGNLVEFGCSLGPTPAEMAATYAGIFLVGHGASPDLLAEYVRAGGNVYVAGGSGAFASPRDEALFWNPFLTEFGLVIAEASDGITRVESGAVPTQHHLTKGVTDLYFENASYIGNGSRSSTLSAYSYPGYRNLFTTYDGRAIRVAGFRPTSVEVSTSRPYNFLTQSAQYSATVRFGTSTMAAPLVNWSSSDPSIATIDDDGVVTAHGLGTVTITATSYGVSGTAQLDITGRWFMSSTEGSPGAQLREGQYLQSRNGQYWLVMQADCNLVLYRGPPGDWSRATAVWGSGTNGRNRGGFGTYLGSCTTTVEQDGNVVIYLANVFNPASAVWAAGVRGLGQYHIAVEDDGRWALYQGAGPATRGGTFFSIPF